MKVRLSKFGLKRHLKKRKRKEEEWLKLFYSSIDEFIFKKKFEYEKKLKIDVLE